MPTGLIFYFIIYLVSALVTCKVFFKINYFYCVLNLIIFLSLTTNLPSSQISLFIVSYFILELNIIKAFCLTVAVSKGTSTDPQTQWTS